MAEALPILTMPDMGGGVNTGIAVDAIGDNEFSRLINFTPDGPSIKRRGGTKRITVNRYNPAGTGLQELTSFHRFVSEGGLWALIVGAQRSVAMLDAGGMDLRVLSEPQQYVDSFTPWVWEQYKDVVYGFRTGPGMIRVQVVPSERISAPGMDAPLTAPTLAQGAAGSIPAASFTGVVTCYNRRTGQESNPSPASATYSHAGSFKINWSGIPVCPEDQADSRRLYRSLPNQAGAWYRVTTIGDNFTTTYVGDDLLVAALGPAASQKNGKPPINLLMGKVWRDRMFVSDGFYVYWSEIGLMESFDPANAIPVSPDDGFMITGLHEDEDRLYIQKPNGIHYLTGSDRGTYELHTLDPEHGGWAFYGMASAGGRLYWLGWDDLYVSSGGPGVPASNPKMRRYLDKMDRDKLYLSHVTVVPDKELLLLTVPLREAVDVPNARTTTLVFNYRTNAWSVWGTNQLSTNLNFLRQTFDRYSEPVLWALFSYGLFTHDDPYWNYDEADSSITSRGAQLTPPPRIHASFRTRGVLSSPGKQIVTRRVKLLGDPVYNVPPGPINSVLTADAVLQLYGNGNEVTPIKARPVVLDGIDDWRSFNLSTLGRPVSSLIVELLYRGVPTLELHGLGLEVATVARHRRAY